MAQVAESGDRVLSEASLAGSLLQVWVFKAFSEGCPKGGGGNWGRTAAVLFLLHIGFLPLESRTFL